MTLNIRSRAAAETLFVHLHDADDSPLYADEAQTEAVGVTIYGPGTKQWQRAKSAQENHFVQRLARRGSKSELSADEKRKQTAEFLADVTVSWHNMSYGEGEDAPTGRDLSIAIYTDASIGFIADQVYKAAHDWSLFTKGSAKS